MDRTPHAPQRGTEREGGRLPPRKTAAATRLALAGTAGAAAAVLYLLDPASCAWLPPCPFRALTGFLCPGCGSLRALHQLLHGHFASALRLNPLAAVGVPLLILSAGAWSVLPAGRRPAHGGRVPACVAWLALLLLLAFWLLRNLPPARAEEIFLLYSQGRDGIYIVRNCGHPRGCP